jgi:hypothetical protein
LKIPLLVASLILVSSQLLSGCYNTADRELRLVQHAAVSRAVVVVSSCDKLIGVKYEFVVAEVKYRGSAPWPEVSCHNTRIGESFSVFYDPENPAVNTIENPTVVYQRAKGWFMPAWLAVPLIFMAIVVVISLITLAQRGADSSQPKLGPPR